jgi:hypothetical protein
MLSLLEITKGLLMAYFSLMEQMGKTREEADAYFSEQYKKFKGNRPETLPDV